MLRMTGHAQFFKKLYVGYLHKILIEIKKIIIYKEIFVSHSKLFMFLLLSTSIKQL